ncbi:hypothetical protein QFZ80_000939 [Paenibacillus sp. V4I7]|nr:hypothetical protein [Paenibacillus sp. V4I7]MDQ0916739.1 hypothetical protein [Paenibacillus sp. V4I5]
MHYHLESDDVFVIHCLLDCAVEAFEMFEVVKVVEMVKVLKVSGVVKVWS